MTALPQKRLTKGQRIFSDTLNKPSHTQNVPVDHWGHISEANWSVGYKRDPYFSTSFSIKTRKRGKTRRKRKTKT